MYKTAIAHLDNSLSYEDALNQFRVAYPEYEIRGVKQASNGWLAFIQKGAYQDNFPVEDVPAETETFSPGADDAEIDSMLEEVSEEPSAEEYGEEEEKQEGLLSELEAAIDRVEQLVSEIKASEDEEEEVRPFDVPEEDDEMEVEGEGFEKEMPLTLEREKEAGLSFASAANEIEELVGTEYKGYRVASVKETKKSYVATLVKR